jgi:hypothetical protein
MPVAECLTESIAAFRAARAESLRTALGNLAGPTLPSGTALPSGASGTALPSGASGAAGHRPEIEYALIHHCVLGVKKHLDHGDRTSALAVARAWLEGTAPATMQLPPGELMVCLFDKLRDGDGANGDGDGARGETVRLVSPQDGTVLDPARRALVADALTAICSCGYRDVLVTGAGVLVMMQPRGLDQANRSWTSKLVPCTLYTDYGTVGALFGAEVLHEATHSWLNDCFSALGVELPPEARYFSPWKQQPRPAFGFLHATLAFSRVFNYLRAALYKGLLGDGRGLRDYCQARIAAEGQRLASTGDDIARALELIPDDRLRNVFGTELARTRLFGSRFAAADNAAADNAADNAAAYGQAPC